MNLTERTKTTLAKKSDLLADLAKTKKRGYSLNDEEYIIGLISIGAPIINSETKRAIGAVSFTFSASEYSLEKMEKKYASAVVDLADEISGVIPIG
jgi:IclR family pca regulon transcriptional regulator